MASQRVGESKTFQVFGNLEGLGQREPAYQRVAAQPKENHKIAVYYSGTIFQSPISNLQSPIPNLQSPISNLQSPISNPQ
ncbi:MAG: hypothetical protein ABIG63_05580 [Chloroflexota bacterium]